MYYFRNQNKQIRMQIVIVCLVTGIYRQNFQNVEKLSY